MPIIPTLPVPAPSAVNRVGAKTPYPEMCKPAGGRSPGRNLSTSASLVGSLFFPQSKNLGSEVGATVSPGVLKKAVHAGTHATSFGQASDDLQNLAEVDISEARVRRFTERTGEERIQERDEEVEHWESLSIPAQGESPITEIPEVACVQMDGGRVQIWDRDTTADDDSATEGAPGVDPGSKSTFWHESKVGACSSMTSEPSENDPCPTIPETFVDPKRIDKLSREIKNAGKNRAQASGPNAAGAKKEAEELDAALEVVIEAKEALAKEEGTARYQPPKIVEKTVVATQQNVKAFGPMLAALAYSLGFSKATRKAFLGDGSSTIWSVWQTLFSHYTPIVDFVHAICYVYHAAMAGLPAQEAWETYCQWAQWVWSGEATRVIDALTECQKQIGEPLPEDPESHPRQVVATAKRYLSNQKSRMKYDEYRKQGLPITSSHIESTIKQINRRVKGSEKFWNSFGAETLLQLVADTISDTGRLAAFWKNKQAKATGQRHYRTAA